MAGTDLFNSTKGQYSNYTTLIGGKPPKANDYMLESFPDKSNIETISGSYEVSDTGLVPTGGNVTEHAFTLTQKEDLKDFVEVIEYTVGASKDLKIGGIGRYSSNSQYLYGLIDGQSKKLSVFKKGTANALASTTIPDLVVNKTYWLVIMFVGGYVRCVHYTENPKTNPDHAAMVTHPLSTADVETFDVASQTGIAGWIPAGDGARIVSVQTGQSFADATGLITTTLAQTHVDIRDFVNYRYPVRYRNLRELKSFHMTEGAFSQTITLTVLPTSGTFNILFYPSDADPQIPIQIGPFKHNDTSDAIKKELNRVLNALPKFSVFPKDPIKNVTTSLTSTKELLVEFDEMFGEVSLLQMMVGSLLPATETEGSYDATNKIGTFATTIIDQGFIETADPLNEFMTIDDLRIEYRYKNEGWVLRSGYDAGTPPAGTSPVNTKQFNDSDFNVGKIQSEGNGTGATLSFSRAASKNIKWAVYMQSATSPINCTTIGQFPGTRPNVTDDNNLAISVVFTDFPWGDKTAAIDIDNAYDAGGCFIQFTSSKDGSFSSDPTSNSAPVSFKSHMLFSGTRPSRAEFRAKLSEFAADPKFDFSRVTGVRIFLKGLVAAVTSSKINVMSIRCIDTSLVGGKKWLTAEINTLEQSVSAPAQDYTGAVASIPPMIVGKYLQSIGADPSPLDSRESLQFRTGQGLSVNYNVFMIFGRELEYDDAYRSDWMTAEYGYKNVTVGTASKAAYLKRYKTNRILSNQSGLVLYWDTHPGGIYEDAYDGIVGIGHLPVPEPERNYELSAQFVSNSVKFEMSELSSSNQPVKTIYSAPLATNEEWTPLAGRIGWYVEFADKDVLIEAFDLESAGYAVLKTKTFVSETPMEGAQLFTVDSGERNLFERFTPLASGDQVYIDNQKTSSGLGSFVMESFGSSEYPGVVSNEFTVDDWSHMYIEFDIWVPASLKNDALRPKMVLRPAEQPPGTSGFDIFSGIVPVNGPYAFDFTPGAWSKVSYDLRGTNAKNGNYFLVLVSDGDGLSDESVFRNKYWIDNIKINTQTIEWEVRAIKDGSWTPFKRNVNQRYGAVHLADTQMGRYVQLQARALTEDAWIAEYTLIPKYQQLGRIP